MYIEAVPNRNSPPAILLRESYRVGGKIKKRTLLNLSDWSPDLVEGLRALLKGGAVLPPGQEAITIKRSLPHGHVAAVLGTLRKIGLDRLLGPAGNRCRDLVIAMIVARLIAPVSKLATAKALDPATAASSLGAVLDLGEVDEDELYTALDWLLERQPQIESRAGQTPSQERHAGALRRLLELFRGALLPDRPTRLQSRRQVRQAADRLRPAVCVGRLSGRHRGVRRRNRRSHHPCDPDR
jgi:hypothetical protein